MKKLLFTIAMLIGMIGEAQNICTYSWMTDDEGHEFSFDIINDVTGDTLYHGSGYDNNQMYWLTLNLPNGTWRVDMHDSGCNGFSGCGFMSMVYQGIGLWHVINNYGCEESRSTWYEYYDPCTINACTADFNGNGTVDVNDLIYFISTYGTTCE